MANTALNRTTVAILTNKSGGALVYGDVVVLDNTNDNGFTTTTTAGLSTRGIGVIIEPNGLANNASGLVAVGGWIPKINLNAAATAGQFIKTHTVAGQGTPHASPQAEGDFAIALEASATPEAILFGSPVAPSTVSDADKGDITVTASGATWTIDAGVVTGSKLSTTSRKRSVCIIIGDRSNVITTGVKFDIRFAVACTITKVSLLADQSGSIVIDLWKDTYANYPPTVADTITAAAKPTISAATKSEDATLTGWTTSITAGDSIRGNVDSIATLTQVSMLLEFDVTA